MTARWFRWKSGHEKWPGSVSDARGSFPGGCSRQWEADSGGPRRTESRRSGGRGRRWCLAVWGEWREKERVEWKERQLVMLLSQKRGGEGGRAGRLLRQRGGGRQSRGAAWHARERAREEKLGRCSGWGRCVEAKAAGGGAGEDLVRR
jgi:hypothetical protein